MIHQPFLQLIIHGDAYCSVSHLRQSAVMKSWLICCSNGTIKLIKWKSILSDWCQNTEMSLNYLWNISYNHQCLIRISISTFYYYLWHRSFFYLNYSMSMTCVWKNRFLQHHTKILLLKICLTEILFRNSYKISLWKSSAFNVRSLPLPAAAKGRNFKCTLQLHLSSSVLSCAWSSGSAVVFYPHKCLLKQADWLFEN